jgi:hypothetical protein
VCDTCFVLQKVAGSNMDLQTDYAKMFFQFHPAASHTGTRPVLTVCCTVHYTDRYCVLYSALYRPVLCAAQCIIQTGIDCVLYSALYRPALCAAQCIIQTGTVCCTVHYTRMIETSDANAKGVSKDSKHTLGSYRLDLCNSFAAVSQVTLLT